MSIEALLRPGDAVDAIRLSPEDNVATLLRAAAAGDRLRVRCGGTTTEIEAREAIPFCHKVSLIEIPAGATVLKYGHSIGAASAYVPTGAHVHVHNLQSVRARAADGPAAGRHEDQ